MRYDSQGVRAFFDQYGTREWERLEKTLQGRIKYAIHRRFLDEYVPDGARVLDAGCGPGRFALDLARRGARLTLLDISPVQLDMAREKLAAAGQLEKVQAFHCLDMLDLHEFPDASFDVVVCYGAALSYIYDRYEAALHELARVLAPGGRLLISVVSLYGTLRLIGPYDDQTVLEQPDAHLDWEAVMAGGGVVLSRLGSSEFHQPMVLLTSFALQQAIDQVGLHVLQMAAANPVVSQVEQIPRITGSAQASAALTALEMALCTQPGLIDTGEHLLAVAVK